MNIIFRWQCLKIIGTQSRKCFLWVVCHLLKELVLTHQATPIKLMAVYMHILNKELLQQQPHTLNKTVATIIMQTKIYTLP